VRQGRKVPPLCPSCPAADFSQASKFPVRILVQIGEEHRRIVAILHRVPEGEFDGVLLASTQSVCGQAGLRERGKGTMRVLFQVGTILSWRAACFNGLPEADLYRSRASIHL
jgi:hypothetical protein